MKHWQETRVLFDEMAALRRAGRKGALAMIVGLEGSAYRSPGAKLLVRDDGSMIGNMSGGCLENDVRENALKVMKTGEPKLVRYDTSGDENVVWGLGVGCNGKVELIVQSIDHAGLASVVEDVRRRVAGNEPFNLSAVLSGPSTGVFSTGLAIAPAAEGIRVFTEKLVPPPRLIVCGAGDDSIPLVRLATESGFRVTVVDHRPAFLTHERFPSAIELLKGRADEVQFAFPLDSKVLCVVKLHIVEHDRTWLRRFAECGVRYIGLLGSRSRREDMTQALSEAQKSLIFGPVGLDLGAEGPEQIAVSVVAELLAVWSGREPKHLRDRTKPIHVAG